MFSQIIVRCLSTQYLKHYLTTEGFYLTIFYFLLLLELAVYSRSVAPCWTWHTL